MSHSSDKQLPVGDCGRLLPPNLHVLLDTVQNLSLFLLKVGLCHSDILYHMQIFMLQPSKAPEISHIVPK